MIVKPAISQASPDWPGLKDWLTNAIERSHILMETPNTPEATTNFLRGQIAAYRAIITSVEPAFIPPPVETHYT